jgi:outer membrane usher protein FimD/PapC
VSVTLQGYDVRQRSPYVCIMAVVATAQWAYAQVKYVLSGGLVFHLGSGFAGASPRDVYEQYPMYSS